MNPKRGFADADALRSSLGDVKKQEFARLYKMRINPKL